jgi:hypothetical protein
MLFTVVAIPDTLSEVIFAIFWAGMLATACCSLLQPSLTESSLIYSLLTWSPLIPSRRQHYAASSATFNLFLSG